MAEQAETGRTSVVPAGVQHTRTGLAGAVAASRRALHRVRGRGRSAVDGTPEPGRPSPEDEIPASSTDLADADVAVQRTWEHVRLVIAIIVTVAPVVTALIAWRIRVWRARRRGGLVDL